MKKLLLTLLLVLVPIAGFANGDTPEEPIPSAAPEPRSTFTPLARPCRPCAPATISTIVTVTPTHPIIFPDIFVSGGKKGNDVFVPGFHYPGIGNKTWFFRSGYDAGNCCN